MTATSLASLDCQCKYIVAVMKKNNAWENSLFWFVFLIKICWSKASNQIKTPEVSSSGNLFDRICNHILHVDLSLGSDVSIHLNATCTNTNPEQHFSITCVSTYCQTSSALFRALRWTVVWDYAVQRFSNTLLITHRHSLPQRRQCMNTHIHMFLCD